MKILQEIYLFGLFFGTARSDGLYAFLGLDYRHSDHNYIGTVNWYNSRLLRTHRTCFHGGKKR